MDAREMLVRAAEERKTILCFGIDPDIRRMEAAIGHGKTVEQTITQFFHPIIEKLLEENAVSALKPNYAYFAQFGFEGLYALQDIIQHYRGKVPIILDGKRGDIGKSSEAYAHEAYEFWGADAVTISPYMGEDSVKPFVREGKLAYMLCRTSNPGAKDFEELMVGKKAVYEHVAEKAMEWKTGLVVGATSDAIKKLAKATKNEVPFLIPGIGSQGGDLAMVMDAIKANPHIHRINASSSIAYAYQKAGGNPADAALKEAEKLNETIRKHL
ncbi:MAG: orotidine-5'-phosphate decarboxylase [Candidatus Micrarchaeota archaeon]